MTVYMYNDGVCVCVCVCVYMCVCVSVRACVSVSTRLINVFKLFTCFVSVKLKLTYFLERSNLSLL